MMLEERGWFDRARIELVGSDASPAAIEKARAGLYGERAFRNMPPALRERYFHSAGDRWAVSRDLHQRIAFDVVNVMDADAVARHAAVPVVFCRNLFIYFSERSIGRAVGAFARSMLDPALLCVGVSESLLRLATPFELREIGGAFVYVRKDGPAASQPGVTPDASLERA